MLGVTNIHYSITSLRKDKKFAQSHLRQRPIHHIIRKIVERPNSLRPIGILRDGIVDDEWVVLADVVRVRRGIGRGVVWRGEPVRTSVSQLQVQLNGRIKIKRKNGSTPKTKINSTHVNP
jgi:hypothetical protein